MNVLAGIFQVFFWAAVLAYVPSAVYLVLNPIRSIRAERARSQGIFILQAEDRMAAEKKRRLQGVGIIYGICLLLVLGAVFAGFLRGQGFGVGPFDILSSLSIMAFCFAALTYLPFAYYVVMKNPWQFRAEGLYVRRVFVVYGFALLIYGVMFALRWLKARGIIVVADEFVSSFMIIFFSATCLSYLPVLLYTFITLKNPFKRRKVSLRIIFAIYTLCFLLFSGVYVHDWVGKRSLQKGKGRVQYAG